MVYPIDTPKFSTLTLTDPSVPIAAAHSTCFAIHAGTNACQKSALVACAPATKASIRA